jgi:dynein heavy chain 1
LEELIQAWVSEFKNFKEIEDQESNKIVHEGMRHEIKSEKNVFYLDPPLEHAKFCWLQEFHRIIGTICELTRLEADPYSGSLGTREKRLENYENVLQRINPDVLQKAYN